MTRPPFRARRGCRVLAIAACVAVVATSCGFNRTKIDAKAHAAYQATPPRQSGSIHLSPTLPPSDTEGPTTSLPATAGKSAGACNPQDLMTCIVAIPSDARLWRPMAHWASEGPESVDNLIAYLWGSNTADDQQIARLHLQTRGLVANAHRTWIARNGGEADIVLFRFGDDAGALSEYDAVTSSASLDSKFSDTWHVSSGIANAGFTESTLDSIGNIRARLYARVGTVVMFMYFFFPAHMDTATATLWATAELDLLSS